MEPIIYIVGCTILCSVAHWLGIRRRNAEADKYEQLYAVKCRELEAEQKKAKTLQRELELSEMEVEQHENNYLAAREKINHWRAKFWDAELALNELKLRHEPPISETQIPKP